MKKNKLVKYLLFVVLVVAVGFSIKKYAMATGLLSDTVKSVFVGDRFNVMKYVDEDYHDKLDNITVFVNQEKSNMSAGVFNPNKKEFEAMGEGTVVLEFEYINDNTGATLHDSLTIDVFEAEELTLEYGSTDMLAASEYYSTESIVTYSSKQDSVVITDEGCVSVRGFEPAEIYGNREGVIFKVATVNVVDPEFVEPNIARAVGSKGLKVEVSGFNTTEEQTEKISYSVEDENIATWTEEGFVGVTLGDTAYYATVTAANGDQRTIEGRVFVTEPYVSKESQTVAQGDKKKVVIMGTTEYSTVEWDTDDVGPAYFDGEGNVVGDYQGVATLYLTVDGKEIECSVNVSNPSYNELTVIMYKGQTKDITISGLNANSTVYAKSANTYLKAQHLGGGNVRLVASATGHATLNITADGREMSILVEIASKKGYQASRKAIAISKTKTKYSQARRMSGKNYDCSSLVSRVYRKYKVYFGSKKGWSPVAAALGKYCAKHKKTVAKKSVNYTSLLPGDVIFISDWRNGRYKNITHTEMYVGGAMDVSASSSRGRVIHYPYNKARHIVLIGRPAK